MSVVRFADLDAAQRSLERYHAMSVEPGARVIVRVDGRSFTALTASRYHKPFSLRFAEIMLMTGAALLMITDLKCALRQ